MKGQKLLFNLECYNNTNNTITTSKSTVIVASPAFVAVATAVAVMLLRLFGCASNHHSKRLKGSTREWRDEFIIHLENHFVQKPQEMRCEWVRKKRAQFATIPLLMLSDIVRVILCLCWCEHEQLWFFGELLLLRCRRIETIFTDYIKRDGVQKCHALIIIVVDVVVDSKTRCWQLLMMIKISIQFVSATMLLLHWVSE